MNQGSTDIYSKKEILLELKNGHVHYGGVRALDGVDVDIKEGEIVALLGPNGAGKSTVLKSFFGLADLTPQSKDQGGSVYFRGNKIDPVPHKMVPLGVSFVPQGKRVFTNLSVEENIEIGGVAIPDKSVIAERLKETLELFPALKTKLSQKAGQLSGGQQQMVAIARALIADPRLLLLDEPTLGLSPKVVKEVVEKIKEINEKRQTAIVVVEHNLKSLLPICHRVYVLDKGKVAKEGSPDEILKSGIIERVFLGKV